MNRKNIWVHLGIAIVIISESRQWSDKLENGSQQ